MANKKFWLGMLVMVLVFGMTVIGCDNDGGGADTPTNETAGITTAQRATVDTAFHGATITAPGTGGLASNQVRLTGLAAGFQYNIGLGNSAPSATAGWQSPNSALTWTIGSGSGQAALWVRAIGNTTVGVRVGAIHGVNITQPSGGQLTITGLSEFNGRYAHFVNNFGDFTLALMGMSSVNLQNEIVTLPQISGGSVTIPMWRLDFDTDGAGDAWVTGYERFTGNANNVRGWVIIFNNATLSFDDLDDDNLWHSVRVWESINFQGGNASVTWASGTPYTPTP